MIKLLLPVAFMIVGFGLWVGAKNSHISEAGKIWFAAGSLGTVLYFISANAKLILG